ncbi:peroxisomal 3-ketoacyl-CoA thiolase B [Capsaspora owczarzaki ATCC 30864]|uniref:acetyl-CoA C-acyltransferase n=1 Tax=Capsaspora owczarzaki (strain ATCC 30864) TaxID=595528 RepID=A0A0D2WLI9_CAPO3|nr:peroxisomal 3-ketoacyl-CoA thiolase B [Capsaspora owczarzaki ATCC 30864]KJE91455.1 peroxisomal 3-ketoacyl-CoA thiolase B [Capsaspora owczarzaki ATCC 30864]|eukprot:XP_004349337.1 peroxisomal 3-ketoacyl-CoA thiolase B [Capsaspora owczarzaki ATCC 30864]
MERLSNLAGHLLANGPAPAAASAAPSAAAFPKRDDDVVIVSAVRTPITKAKRGGFRDTPPDDLLAAAMQAAVQRANVDPKLIGDIVVGNVLQPGAGALTSRFAQFFAGIPETTPIVAVNRQCSSGLQACANIASSIRFGTIDIGLAAGVESMTQAPMTASVPENLNPRVGTNDKASDCLIPMGITSENVAARYGVSRADQDAFAALSHQRAAKAQQEGLFANEIIPVTVTVTDKEGNEKQVTVSADDGVRADTTAASLSKLKPAFSADGSTTAGNSSQVSDGAAAVVMARRSVAVKLGLPILGTFRGFAVAGVAPDEMGIGPAVAIPAALEKAGLRVSDIDIYEINEAFASQALYSVRKLGIPMERVNPKGGAIALGHPLGCTGARQVSTLLYELKRRKQRLGVVSMCIGTGAGAAAIFEAEL